MKLNERQREAVEYLSGPLLVLAGPGTGKTQLLSEKVAYILSHTDTGPENILCLTFTETGALNMRERLKSIIGPDALKVTISTYHSFGMEILALYKNYAPDFSRRLESPIDEITQYKIVSSIQDSLDGNDILRGDNVRDIISVISEAKAAKLSASDLALVAKMNMEDSEVLSSAISPLLLNVVPRAYEESLNNAYAPIYNILSSYMDSTIPLETHSRPFGRACGPKEKSSRPCIERMISILARDLEEAIKTATGMRQLSELTKWKNKYFEKDEQGGYRLKDRVANLKLKSIAGVMEKYEEYLKENGLFDFDDMIEEAGRMLREDAGFRMTLQERYQFIMLDEFQDTNPSQFAIVKELTDYEKPMIMAVGDDDQAIYEFQGALSTNLTDFRDHYDAHVVTLVDNYRSTGEILDFSREIIRQATDRFSDKELKSHREPASGASEIHRLEFLSSDAEYAFIADKILELIRSGVPQREIAVISYKTKYFEPLLAFLKAYPEIKIAYEKRDNLFDDPDMKLIFDLSRLAYEISERKRPSVSMLEILSHPCFKIPRMEILKLTFFARDTKKSILDCALESEVPEIKAFSELFSELVSRGVSDSLPGFLDYLVEETVKPADLTSYEAFTFYENYAALVGRLKKHFGEKALKLSDLISLLDDLEAAGMPLNVTSPYRDALDAVQILSAHKAKGLEFEYVFIVSADHTAWGAGKGNNNLLSLPKNLIQIRHTGMTDSERLRVLYVALTRAKQYLYITNSVTDFSGKSPERLEYLQEYVNSEKKLISPYLPNKLVQCKYKLPSAPKMVRSLQNWLSPYLKLSPDLCEIYRERALKLRMSASALTSFIEIRYDGPESFFKNYLLGVPSGPETEQMAFGNLIHATFQKVTDEGLSVVAAQEFYLAELSKTELGAAAKKKLADRGPVCIEKTLGEFGEVIRSGRAEVNLAAEKIVAGGVPVTGKIDHVLIDDKAKTIEVFDFKTGGYHKEKWKSHASLFQYMLQLLFYKMLLNNSREYRDYKVTRGHILFVAPDKDGEVHDKVYEYDAKDEAEFLGLLRAVYKLVTTLEFMRDSEIFIPADEKYTFADIKNFIKLLLEKSDHI